MSTSPTTASSPRPVGPNSRIPIVKKGEEEKIIKNALTLLIVTYKWQLWKQRQSVDNFDLQMATMEAETVS